MEKMDKRKNRKIKESSLEDWENMIENTRIEKSKNEKNKNDFLNSENNNLFMKWKTCDPIDNFESKEFPNLKYKIKTKKRTKSVNYFGSRLQEELY